MTDVILKEIERNSKKIDKMKQEIALRELLILELRTVLGNRERPFQTT